MPTAWDTAAVVVVVVLIALVAASFVAYARTWTRVDAPVNPPGVARIRRRYGVWVMSGQNGLRYIAGIVIGLILLGAFYLPPNHNGGENVEVSAPAARSPARAGVVTTMNDYFAGFNTGPVCRYTSAFSAPLRPPAKLADCKSTVSSTPEVEHITVDPDGSVNVQVTFVSRRKGAAGQPHDVCTKWTSDFRMISEAGQLRIVEPPAFRSTPAKC
jgi:hypothetical protein